MGFGLGYVNVKFLSLSLETKVITNCKININICCFIVLAQPLLLLCSSMKELNIPIYTY